MIDDNDRMREGRSAGNGGVRRGASPLSWRASEQIGVGAGAGEGQDELVFLDGVDQDPVGFDVAVTIPFKVVVQRMAV